MSDRAHQTSPLMMLGCVANAGRMATDSSAVDYFVESIVGPWAADNVTDSVFVDEVRIHADRNSALRPVLAEPCFVWLLCMTACVAARRATAWRASATPLSRPWMTAMPGPTARSMPTAAPLLSSTPGASGSSSASRTDSLARLRSPPSSRSALCRWTTLLLR